MVNLGILKTLMLMLTLPPLRLAPDTRPWKWSLTLLALTLALTTLKLRSPNLPFLRHLSHLTLNPHTLGNLKLITKNKTIPNLILSHTLHPYHLLVKAKLNYTHLDLPLKPCLLCPTLHLPRITRSLPLLPQTTSLSIIPLSPPSTLP